MTIIEKLSLLEKPVLYIGIGNEMKGDDGLGCEIAGRLKAKKPGINVIDCKNVPENYIKEILSFKPETIVFIDAVVMQEEPGFIDLIEQGRICQSGISTHAVSLGLLAELINTMSKAKIYILGIQPSQVTLGAGFSLIIQETISKIVDILE